jgi:CubicO group peptidase (beta-lactamase class C family)
MNALLNPLNTLLRLLIAFVVACVLGCAPTDTPAVIDEAPADELSGVLSALLPPLQKAYSVPGTAVGVIRNGKVVLERGFGSADKEADRPVGVGTAFNIGSISKTVASWGVMALVEEGEIDLDAPVSNYLSRWQLPESEYDHDKVTMRRLLSHTAGLSVHGYRGFSPDVLLPTVEESLSGARNGAGAVHVAHEPGSKWQYSGGGYTLAQLIVEEVTGRPFAEYMETKVLEPLGMKSSSYVWDDEIDRIAATPYDDAGDPIPGPRFTAMAAASLQTTLGDFLQFVLASMGGENQVLKPATVESMQQAVLPADDYGIGYDIEEHAGLVMVGHGGSNDGWMARFKVVPATGDGIVVMTNGSNGGLILDAVFCEWWGSVAGEPCSEKPELPVEVAEKFLTRTEGRYQVPGGNLLEFRVESGRLFVILPNGFRAVALARSETEFFTGAIRGSFQFVIDDEGKATELIVRQGDQPGQTAPRIGDAAAL